MKDKTKGLLLGLTIGTMLSGTAAYAGSTQIEVAFRELKYMFDGVEKQPGDEKGFIYNGSTYVPLRFVSEALGKNVAWDESTSTIWIGDKTASSSVVAAYSGGTVTKGEFDTYLAVQKFLNPSYAQHETQDDYKTYMINQLITERWFASQANAEQKASAEQQAKSQIAEWQQSSGGEEKFRNALAAVKLVQSDLEKYVYGTLLFNGGIQGRVNDEQLRATYEATLKSDPGMFTIANVRHILVGLKDDNGQPLRTEADALTRAREVLVKLRAGSDFAQLAKTYSDDPGSKDNGGLYTDFEIGTTVPEFKKAVATLPLNQNSDPVLTEFGYHIIRVESRKTQSFDEVKDRLRQAAVQDAVQKFRNDELPKLIQSVTLPK